MNRLEILVEEPSIKEVLKILLPKLLPNGWELNVNCFVRSHEGKQDLQKSIPRKIRAAAKQENSNTAFIILQDQDSNDCIILKEKLATLCSNANNGARNNVSYKIRIVCHELESWYLGDMDALAKVFPHFPADKYRNSSRFRNPDACVNPKKELQNIVGEYNQLETARHIARNMDIDANVSESFRSFVSCFRGEGRFVNPIV